MSFHVGQKVVCVDAANYFTSGAPHALKQGAVYEVSENHGWAISIVGGPVGYMHAFNNIRFRPVVERETDISALTELLNPLNHKPLPDVTPVKAPARV